MDLGFKAAAAIAVTLDERETLPVRLEPTDFTDLALESLDETDSPGSKVLPNF